MFREQIKSRLDVYGNMGWEMTGFVGFMGLYRSCSQLVYIVYILLFLFIMLYSKEIFQ